MLILDAQPRCSVPYFETITLLHKLSGSSKIEFPSLLHPGKFINQTYFEQERVESCIYGLCVCSVNLFPPGLAFLGPQSSFLWVRGSLVVWSRFLKSHPTLYGSWAQGAKTKAHPCITYTSPSFGYM